MEDRFSTSTFTWRWLVQAGLGLALLVLLGIHLLVNHYAAPQGLLTYAEVIRYYDVPGVAWMEALFLVVVTGHCVLGLHGILLDLNPAPRTTSLLAGLLVVAGGAAIVYGLWLIRAIALLSVS